MSDYIQDLALSQQKAISDKMRELHSDVNAEVGSIYRSYHKGFTNCGNAKHIAECYQAHVGLDPDLTSMINAKTKKEQYFYLNRYLQRYPECKIDGGGVRVHKGGGANK